MGTSYTVVLEIIAVSRFFKVYVQSSVQSLNIHSAATQLRKLIYCGGNHSFRPLASEPIQYPLTRGIPNRQHS